MITTGWSNEQDIFDSFFNTWGELKRNNRSERRVQKPATAVPTAAILDLPKYQDKVISPHNITSHCFGKASGNSESVVIDFNI